MSGTRLEDQLRAEIARMPAQVPSGLARTAYQRYRRRRTTTVRAITAAGTAAMVAGAAIGVGLTLSPGTTGPGQTTSAAYVVDRVTQAVDALPADAIMFERTTYRSASPSFAPQDTWAGGNGSRTETFTAAGQPATESGFAVMHNRITQTQVNYQDKTWSRSVTTFPHGRPSPTPSASASCADAGFITSSRPTATSSANGGASGVSDVNVVGMMFVIGQPASMVAPIRTALSCGKLKVAGYGDIDGISCVKLVEKADGVTLIYWASRSTYLPVRLVTQMSGMPTEQDDFGWLPPTPANLALVTVPIPAGFTRVAPPELP